MRTVTSYALAALFCSFAWGAHGAAPSAKDAALAAGDWRKAAALGATAADVVRGLQAHGQATDAVPEESVVTIKGDNTVDVVALKPLPPLEAADTAGGRTAGLSGSGFSFSTAWGAIVLYPTDARTFAPAGARP